MRLLAPVIVAVSLAIPFDSTSLAQTQLWYYCQTTHEFYPYTQRCPVPWRAVKPYNPVPLVNSPRSLLPPSESQQQPTATYGFDDTLNPGCAGLGITTARDAMCRRPAPQPYELRHTGANTADEKAAGETAYNNCLAQPPSSSMPGSAFRFDGPIWMDYRQKWREKCDEAERAAIIQFRTQTQTQAQAQAQADRAAYEQRRAIEKAKSKGYELIPTVKDLILDGKELADRNAKVQITGFFKKMGNNGVLYGSAMEAYSNTDNYMPVLTDDAARSVREALMNYACQPDFGCEERSAAT